jgi:hypothetical protein
MRRDVVCDGLMARIGTGGRSRAIRRAVEPDLLKTTIVFAFTVPAIWREDPDKASAIVGSIRVSVKWMREK